jgi:Zn-dependent peptidase ImmA (M78 family)
MSPSLWLGVTGVSDTESGRIPEKSSERWCNQVAAELLAPLEAVTSVYQPHSSINEQLPTLARKFKVSTLVVLRRLCDAGFLTPNQLWQYHHAERQRLINLQASKSGGGDFYRALPARNSKRFVKALITSTLEGQTLYRDAFRMLNLQKISSFEEIARRLELLL